MAKHVIIVGGGFGGLNTALGLAHHDEVDVTLVDRRNYHLFQPLLYQVATAGLSSTDIATPIRGIFSNVKNIEVMMESVTGIDPVKKTITAEKTTLSYDYLVLACGANHSYFGHPEWEQFAPGLKTLEQATEIRRRILSAFELAEKETDPELKKTYLTFVVIGGGPTGVELAGAIAEISRYTLEKDFRHIDPESAKVILIEAGDKVLGPFGPNLGARAIKDLNGLGVEIRMQTRVSNIVDKEVHIGDQIIKAATILWAAGVKPSELGKKLGVPLDPAGRVIIQKDLSVPGHPDIFVIGDQSHFEVGDKKTLPGLAPVAIQQGKHVAENILRLIKNGGRTDFKYIDKGQLATIGRKKAVMQVGKFEMGGFLAWFAWLFVHIFYLIGFKNKVFVIFQWAWSYFTFKKGARLILSKEWRSESGTT